MKYSTNSILVCMAILLGSNVAVGQPTTNPAIGDEMSINVKLVLSPNRRDERARFVRTAGADAEISETEFREAGKVVGTFARSFDQWEMLIRFDQNHDDTISGHEAESYRQALSEVLREVHDSDGDNRFSALEFESAAIAVDQGTLHAYLVKYYPDLSRNNKDLPGPFAGGFPKKDIRSMNEFIPDSLRSTDLQSDVLRGVDLMTFDAKKNVRDTNGDGRVDFSENYAVMMQQASMNAAAGRKSMLVSQLVGPKGDTKIIVVSDLRSPDHAEAFVQTRRAEVLKRFDRNKNGKLDHDELHTIREVQKMDFFRPFDADQNGCMDSEEMEHWEKSELFVIWNLRMQADINNDGVLDSEELQKHAQDYQSRFNQTVR